MLNITNVETRVYNLADDLDPDIYHDDYFLDEAENRDAEKEFNNDKVLKRLTYPLDFSEFFRKLLETPEVIEESESESVPAEESEKPRMTESEYEFYLQNQAVRIERENEIYEKNKKEGDPFAEPEEPTETRIKVTAEAVEPKTECINTSAPIKETIDSEAVSERLKPHRQSGCMIFTGVKSVSDRAFTKKYYSKINLERHDSFFNVGLCVGYITSEGVSKNAKLKSLETKIYTELTKKAKRKTQAPEKKELISSVVANLVDLFIKNTADYICVDAKFDRLGKLREKKAGIPINKDSQYFQNKPIPRYINDIVNVMERMGLLKKIAGHFSLENEAGNKTRICAAGELKQIMEDMPEDKLKKLITNVADEKIKLKKSFESKGNIIRGCIDYENTDFTNFKRKVMNNIDNLRSKSIIFDEKIMVFKPESLVFGDNFTTGGYSELEDLRKINDPNSRLSIDGEVTEKIDITNSIINIFYFMTQQPKPHGDSYRLTSEEIEAVNIDTSSFGNYHFDLIRDINRTIIHTVLKGTDYKKELVSMFTAGNASNPNSDFYQGVAELSACTDIKSKHRFRCIAQLIKAMQIKHPALFNTDVTYDQVLFNLYDIMLEIRSRMVDISDENKKRRNYSAGDYFSQRKHALSHFSIYDCIICKAIHTKIVQGIIKEVFAEIGITATSTVYSKEITREGKSDSVALYWRLKGKTKYTEPKLNDNEKMYGHCGFCDSIEVNYFEGFKLSHKLTHKELVAAIMEETGYKDCKARRIIKEYLDGGVLIAKGMQRSRYYILSDDVIKDGYQDYIRMLNG